VNTYFKYLFGLVPVVHRPTFMSDVAARREELPGQEEWTALVLAIVGVAMSQVPWDFVTMSKSDLRDMVQKCFDRVKAFVFEDFATPTTTRCESIRRYVRPTDGGAERCRRALISVRDSCSRPRQLTDEAQNSDHGDQAGASRYQGDLSRSKLGSDLQDADSRRICRWPSIGVTGD
jgi:hypothetical protein